MIYIPCLRRPVIRVRLKICLHRPFKKMLAVYKSVFLELKNKFSRA